MRYDSLPNSEKQPSDGQRGWSNSCFHINSGLLCLRGIRNLKSYNFHNSATSCSISGCHASYESYVGPLSSDVRQSYVLQRVRELQTKMKRDACRPQLDLTVQSSKQNNARIMWKGEVSYLSACHLAVSLSWISYHTSFERGHTGLPADIKIRTIFQLIGILWLYFGVQLGSTNEAQHFGLSLCNSLEHIRLSYLRWKKTSIAFIWGMAAWYAQRGCWVMKVVTF